MRGNIKARIDQIVNNKEKDNKLFIAIFKAKLVLKGVYLKNMTDQSYDDPLIIARIEEVLEQFQPQLRVVNL
jgi:hypothetical protein